METEQRADVTLLFYAIKKVLRKLPVSHVSRFPQCRVPDTRQHRTLRQLFIVSRRQRLGGGAGGGASLVQPGLGTRRVGHQLVGLEPQVDLRLGVLQRVAAVDDVPDREEEEEEPQSRLWHDGK